MLRHVVMWSRVSVCHQVGKYARGEVVRALQHARTTVSLLVAIT